MLVKEPELPLPQAKISPSLDFLLLRNLGVCCGSCERMEKSNISQRDLMLRKSSQWIKLITVHHCELSFLWWPCTHHTLATLWCLSVLCWGLWPQLPFDHTLMKNELWWNQTSTAVMDSKLLSTCSSPTPHTSFPAWKLVLTDGAQGHVLMSSMGFHRDGP